MTSIIALGAVSLALGRVVLQVVAAWAQEASPEAIAAPPSADEAAVRAVPQQAVMAEAMQRRGVVPGVDHSRFDGSLMPVHALPGVAAKERSAQ